MPIQRTTMPNGKPGWKWGAQGRPYTTRGEAEAQARAAYANGYTGDSIIEAAGIAFTDPAGAVLFLRRGKQGDHPGEWCLPGGTTEAGESAQDTAAREAREETGRVDVGSLREIARETNREGVDFTTFRAMVPEQFTPRLNREHTEHVWAQPNDAPQPLHPGVKAVLNKFAMDEAMLVGMKPERMAFDRGTVRTFDQDGRLRVEITNISKATVNPYLGYEIPNFDALGLQPEKIYQLLRDPEELAKAAPTFNAIPVLSKHVAVSATDPQKEFVVGASGTDAVFEAPYLRNSLVVWDAEAIAGIESDEQRELSCAYRYVADMTPGNYEGMRYDGVMREIRGNHIALVVDGRAGPDVIVGDSTLKMEKNAMSKKLTKRAVLAQGALMGFLPMRLAKDAKPDLIAILAMDSKVVSWKDQKAELVKALKPSIAKDADVEGLVKLMDALDDQEAMEGEEAMTAVDEPADGVEGLVSGLEQLLSKFKKPAAADADPDDKDGKDKDDDKKAMDAMRRDVAALTKRQAEDKLAHDAALKAANDATTAAITKAAKESETATIARLRGVAEAEETVRPYVGKLTGAFDSAEGVHKAALEILKVDLTDIPGAAYKAILLAQPKPGSSQFVGASDAAPGDDFAKRFPDAQRLAA